MTELLSELAKLVSIESTYIKTDFMPFDVVKNTQMNKYSVKLTYQNRTMGTDFYMGLGLTGKPTIQDVLNSLLIDASYSDYSFEDFCLELGLDTDSRSNLKTYKAIVFNTRKLKTLLGNDFNRFLEAENDV